jgi:hypothetical protein
MKEKNPDAVGMGKLRWKGVPKALRSIQMKAIVKKRWDKKLDKDKDQSPATE